MQTPNLAVAMLQWGVANAFALGLTALLWRRLRVGRPRLDAASFALLAMLTATLLTLAFALAGLFAPMPMFLVSAAGCAGIGWLARSGRVPLRDSIRAMRAQWPRPGVLNACLALLVLAQAVRIAVHTWYLPPFVWDELVYRLPKVVEWIQHERLVDVANPIERSYWPANVELLKAWTMVFPRHDMFVELVSVPYFAVAALSVYCIARTLSLSRRWSFFVALLFAYTPALTMHSASGNNDLPNCAIYLFSVALLLDWQRTRTHLAARVVLIGLLFCLGFGSKPYLLFMAPGLAVFAIPWLWRGAGLEREDVPGPPESRSPSRTLLAVAVVAGVAAAGFWFARNVVIHGNPIYPSQLKVGDLVLLGSGGVRRQQGAFLLSSVVTSFRTLFDLRIFDSVGPYNTDLYQMSGWGWFVFACGLPASFVALLTSPAIRRIALGFTVSMVLVFGFVNPDLWNLRFTIWFPALFALAFGVTASGFRTGALRVAFVALAVAGMLLNFVGTLSLPSATPRVWDRISRLPLRERTVATLQIHAGDYYLHALRTIPPDETIGYYATENDCYYPLYGADFTRTLRWVPIDAVTDVPQAMREHDVSYLVLAPHSESVGAHRVRLAVERGDLEDLGKDLYALPGR